MQAPTAAIRFQFPRLIRPSLKCHGIGGSRRFTTVKPWHILPCFIGRSPTTCLPSSSLGVTPRLSKASRASPPLASMYAGGGRGERPTAEAVEKHRNSSLPKVPGSARPFLVVILRRQAFVPISFAVSVTRALGRWQECYPTFSSAAGEDGKTAPPQREPWQLSNILTRTLRPARHSWPIATPN
jgi:hypothetical protein